MRYILGCAYFFFCKDSKFYSHIHEAYFIHKFMKGADSNILQFSLTVVHPEL